MSGEHITAKSLTIEDDGGNPVLFLGSSGIAPNASTSICLFGNKRESISLQTNPDSTSEISMRGSNGDTVMRLIVSELGVVTLLTFGRLEFRDGFAQITPAQCAKEENESTSQP